eukprot:3331307-Alexandrium_andersonii.AAC.1
MCIRDRPPGGRLSGGQPEVPQGSHAADQAERTRSAPTTERPRQLRRLVRGRHRDSSPAPRRRPP